MQKISRSPSYLIRNPHSYCFRIIVPKDLQPYIGKKELRRSLRTGYMSVAKQKARKMAAEVQTLFEWIRETAMIGDLSDNDIKQMVNEHIQKWLKVMEYLRTERATPEKRDKIDRLMNGWIDRMGKESKEQLIKCDYSSARFYAANFIFRSEYASMEEDAANGIDGIEVPFPQQNGLDRTSLSHRKFCRELLKGLIKFAEVEQRRREADYSDDVDKLFPVEKDDTNGSGVGQIDLQQFVEYMSNQPKDDEPSPLLSELWEKFQKDKLDSGNWRNTTLRNHKPKYTSLLQFIGDIPVNKITKTMIREYREILDHLPPGFALKDYKDLNGIKPNDLDGKHKRTMDVTTVREYMNIARSLFGFAKDNDFIDENPVLIGMIPPKKKATRKLRHPFDDPNDLELVFSEERYLHWSKDRPERFWVPILALYTGCRMEEMCQLYVDDVKQIDGIWCIDIKGTTGNVDEGEVNGQMLKNESAARIVPLHPILVEDFKFPEYSQEVRAKGTNLLFDHLEKSAKTNWKYSHGLSKSFGRYLRNKAGISDSKKIFHSFRHTVADHVFNKTQNESLIEELEGRAGKTETRRTYTQGLRVPVLYKEAILKLNYKVDLSHLKSSKWVPKDSNGPE